MNNLSHNIINKMDKINWRDLLNVVYNSNSVRSVMSNMGYDEENKIMNQFYAIRDKSQPDESKFVELYELLSKYWDSYRELYHNNRLYTKQNLHEMYENYEEHKASKGTKGLLEKIKTVEDKVDESKKQVELVINSVELVGNRVELLTKHIEAMEDKFQLVIDMFQMNFDKLAKKTENKNEIETEVNSLD